MPSSHERQLGNTQARTRIQETSSRLSPPLICQLLVRTKGVDVSEIRTTMKAETLHSPLRWYTQAVVGSLMKYSFVNVKGKL